MAHCQAIAAFTDHPDNITRLFLGPATRACHRYLTDWMNSLGMHVRVDAAGNLRALYESDSRPARRLLIGSHLDSVPNAGRYDGVLGVVLAVQLIQCLAGEHLRYEIEVVGFSEEEGVRFGSPYIGSRALAGTLDAALLERRDQTGISVREAIAAFGLDPSQLAEAHLSPNTGAYLEFHIEQGPVLDQLGKSLGVVPSIMGQNRATLTFGGRPNHAGTTPMHLRHDALCAAAQWVLDVERKANAIAGAVATVGSLQTWPGAGNVIPGEVTASLDVRHADDAVRCRVFDQIVSAAAEVASARGIRLRCETLLQQSAVAMDEHLTQLAQGTIHNCGIRCESLPSGAGHDAAILAPILPSAMLFLRTPNGLSHHPDEAVLPQDIESALRAGAEILERLKQCSYLI